LKTTIKTDGAPEGCAVDEARGLFFTNLDDKGGTFVVDAKTHAVKATWNANCDATGPRGIAFDPAHNFAVVACTDHVQVLDAGHDGALLGKLDAGAGIDNIDCVDGKLYIAAGKVSKLTIATIDDKGQLTLFATGDTLPLHKTRDPFVLRYRQAEPGTYFAHILSRDDRFANGRIERELLADSPDRPYEARVGLNSPKVVLDEHLRDRSNRVPGRRRFDNCPPEEVEVIGLP